MEEVIKLRRYCRKSGIFPDKSLRPLCKKCGKNPVTCYRNKNDGTVKYALTCRSCCCGIKPPLSLEEKRRRHKKKYEQMRRIIVSHYGGKCVCCGETIEEFLTIDHIDNDGAEHRRTLTAHWKKEGIKTIRPASGGLFYRWIIRNNFPSNLQLLCFNCNCGRHRNGGICPHKELRHKKNKSK